MVHNFKKFRTLAAARLTEYVVESELRLAPTVSVAVSGLLLLPYLCSLLPITSRFYILPK